VRRVLVVHGPNLNLLGEREPEVYGSLTLEEIDARLMNWAGARGLELKTFQSNHEGALLDFIQAERRWAQGVVINPGALTHTSVALRDCLAAVALPAVEVHLSDIQNREPFRRHSYLKDVCIAQIGGGGWQSYLKGLEALLERADPRAG